MKPKGSDGARPEPHHTSMTNGEAHEASCTAPGILPSLSTVRWTQEVLFASSSCTGFQILYIPGHILAVAADSLMRTGKILYIIDCSLLQYP